MASPTDDRSPKLPRGWLRAALVSTIALAFVGAAAGFIAFLSQLRGAEIAPSRKADGIVLELGQTRIVDTAPNILADPRIGQLFLGGTIEAPRAA